MGGDKLGTFLKKLRFPLNLSSHQLSPRLVYGWLCKRYATKLPTLKDVAGATGFIAHMGVRNLDFTDGKAGTGLLGHWARGLSLLVAYGISE